jgi:Family of unknown function (DUF5681)
MSNNTKPKGKRRDADITTSKERQLAPLREHAFKPGQSGNPKGRPKGARNRLGTQFLEALEADFKKHGAQAIALVRERKPEVYMRVVADLLPKEANINVEAGEAFVQLWKKISDGLGDELADHLDDDPSLVVH